MLNIWIFLVAHSMGGAVVKKMPMLAKQYPVRWGLASCVHSKSFLATPRGGADSAPLRSHILKVPSALFKVLRRPFDTEIRRNSDH